MATSTSPSPSGPDGTTWNERRGRVAFPEEDGRRTTSALGRAVVADSLRGVSAEHADKALRSRSWRREYTSHFATATRLGAASGARALATARPGLVSLRSRMRWSSVDGDRPLTTEQLPTAAEVVSKTIRGRRPAVTHLEVPYRGRVLTGDTLRAQLDRWAEGGIVEPSFAAAVARAVHEPELLSAPGRSVVLLGAGAAMGPLRQLSRWGAHVVAVDVPVAAVQQRIAALAADGAGTVIVPWLAARDVPGLTVGADLPELLTWLPALVAGSGAPVLATHVYADGGTHVELTVAADLLAETLIGARPDTALAYLATPTDSFLVPADAVAQSRRRASHWSWNGPAHRLAAAVSFGRLCRPCYPTTTVDEHGDEWGLIDTLVAVQGPNYALAKRAQRWRAMVAAAEGRLVSANVAPSAWTRSVTSNRVLAAVYRGSHRFGVEIFESDTAAALMAAKLVVDLAGPAAAPTAHPEALFSHDAAHGGLWRQPFAPLSALGIAAAIGMVVRTRRH